MSDGTSLSWIYVQLESLKERMGVGGNIFEELMAKNFPDIQ